MKKKTLIAVSLVLVIMWAAGPAAARLDERILENEPYIMPPPAIEAVAHSLYEVKPGDTLSNIAMGSGVSVEVLAAANGLLDRDSIRAGLLLLVPSDYTVHLVQYGETLSGIAGNYRVDAGVIATRNRISNMDNIFAGRQLLIPCTAAGDEAAMPVVAGAQVRPLSWPLMGTITSPFGLRDGRPHEGIDIAAEENTPIRASAPGRVVFAGHRGTYGLAVIIDHGGGVRTLYAHCAKLFVSEGSVVDATTVIALAGSTGRSTGPHLHLEVILNGVPVDPLPCLGRESYFG
ncbi:MAG: M23 family metallopeptidase [Desulfotomaculaceae bacterium]|nr:M23 family metallopeptidase [Desulfotomaculaceae bacterium]